MCFMRHFNYCKKFEHCILLFLLSAVSCSLNDGGPVPLTESIAILHAAFVRSLFVLTLDTVFDPLFFLHSAYTVDQNTC